MLVKYLAGESHTIELGDGSDEVDGTNEGIDEGLSDGRKEEEGVDVTLIEVEGEGLADADGSNDGLRDGRDEEDGDMLGNSDG